MIRATEREAEPMRRRRPIIAVAAIATLVALGGCGRKGSLEPPGTVEDQSLLPSVIGTTSTPTPPEEPKKEDKPFFLDFLL